MSFEVRVLTWKSDLEIRDLKRACSEVVQIFKSIYQDNYVKNTVYDEKALVSAIMSSEQVSIIAIDKIGHVLGHIALIYHNNMAEHVEIGQAVVSPSHQRQGILNALVEAAIFTCRNISPEKAIYAVSVTHHEKSQRSIANFHFTEVGVLRGLVPASLVGGDETSKPYDVVIHFKPAATNETLRCYPSLQYIDISKYIFRNTSQERNVLRTPRSQASSGDSIYHLLDRISYNSTEIHFSSVCDESLYFIHMVTKYSSAARRSFLYLYLPISSPGASRLVNKLNAYGYYFAGLLPGTLKGDTLILQKDLKNTESQAPRIFSETGEYMSEFIRQDYCRVTSDAHAPELTDTPWHTPNEPWQEPYGMHEDQPLAFEHHTLSPEDAQKRLSIMSSGRSSAIRLSPLPFL